MRRTWLICGFLGLLLLGCDSAPPKARRGNPEGVGKKDSSESGDQNAKLDDSGGEVRLESLTLTAPKGWPRKKPQSTIIQAEYVLPKADGDERDGRLTLSVAGGSLEANIERWKDQFVGKLEKSHQEKIDVNGISVTLIDFSGEYDDKPGPFAAGVKRAGYRMIGAIIPVGDQLHFVKAVGPSKTMETHAEKIKAFVRSTKK
jgi:hypothetical protein